MANTNLTRAKRFAQKKSECFFAASVTEGTGKGEVPASTANYLIGNLPPDSIITNAYIMVLTASDAATSLTAKIGTAEAGTEVLSAATLKTLGKRGTFTGFSTTSSGVELYLTLTYVGAATAVGDYVVVVEYLEYDKNTGEYTKFS